MLDANVKDLVDARRVAAERFFAIGMAHVPEGWNVKYRKSLTGRCFLRSRQIAAPRPVTRKALYIFLHECAHAHLHANTKRRSSRHLEETEAEQWAHARMREHGIPVPRAMTQRAKRYVAYKIRQALSRGAKTIDPAASRFAR